MTDQQRPDTLGFMGQTQCKTPNIDRIAERGVSFDNMITPCPLCSPARVSLFTSLYPTQNDEVTNHSAHLTSGGLLDQFRCTGYQVNYAGKWHMGESNIGKFTDRYAGDSTPEYSKWCLEQGLIDGWMFNDPTTRTTRSPSMSIPKVHRQDLALDKTNEAYIADFAIDMLRTRDRERPFFQVCSFNGPHPPFMIPEPFFSMYDPNQVSKPDNFGSQAGEHAAHSASYYRDLFNDHGTNFDDWRASCAVYWGFVSMIDSFVGQLMTVLQDAGLRENTVVVFTSDHGENLGAHGLWQKMVPFEESIRVPLIIDSPGQASVRSDTPASLVDVAPTLASLCGIEIQVDWEGRDLSNSETDDVAQFAMHKPLGDWMKVTDWRMIKARGFKYTWHKGMDEELFDMTADPSELTNLAKDQSFRQIKSELMDRLDVFLARTDDPLYPDWKHHFEKVI